MDNMSRDDDRLPNKAYVWGVAIAGDAVCWTDDFVIWQGNIVNAEVGGRPLVVAWDPRYESLGVWYNDTGQPVTEIDFFGNTPAGRLKRVENLRPGLFWHVWVEFFPDTDINRVATAGKAAA
jgi:hypothetical protein